MFVFLKSLLLTQPSKLFKPIVPGLLEPIPYEGPAFEKLGDTCKKWERENRTYASESLLVVRLDGRAFHSLTKRMDKPYSLWLMSAMDICARKLMEEFHCDISYTQSDEITLVWDARKPGSQLPFNGKIDKINSVFAAQCSVNFSKLYADKHPEDQGRVVMFDCRSFFVRSRAGASAVLLWRNIDAIRNSINMLAHCNFSHGLLQGKNQAERLEMLENAGIIWENEPDRYKYGGFLFRDQIERNLSEKELQGIPEKHRPKGPVLRSVIEQEFADLSTMSNPEDFLFPPEEELTPDEAQLH